MSILARFSPSNLTSAQYDDVVRRLRDAGDYPPDGRELHVCFGEDGHLRVSEIWESEEKMQAFAERMEPILGEVGVEQEGPPEILHVMHLDQP